MSMIAYFEILAIQIQIIILFSVCGQKHFKKSASGLCDIYGAVAFGALVGIPLTVRGL